MALTQRQSEWVCLEHPLGSFPRAKAERWWRRRSYARVPISVQEAVHLARAGALCTTKAISIRTISGREYGEIVNYELGEKPVLTAGGVR